MSLSARRVWIEITATLPSIAGYLVALRKESVDRNNAVKISCAWSEVALRKESVDRNFDAVQIVVVIVHVALRKESVDRNYYADKDADWVRGRSPQGECG